MSETDLSLLHTRLPAVAVAAAVVIGTLVAVVAASPADTTAPTADPCSDSRYSGKQRLKAVDQVSKYPKVVEMDSHGCSSGALGARSTLIVIAVVGMSSKWEQSGSIETETPGRTDIEVLADKNLATKHTEVRIEAPVAA